jgi:hypothetical protein
MGPPSLKYKILHIQMGAPWATISITGTILITNK